MEDDNHSVFQIDFEDINLWLALLAFIVHGLICRAMAIWEIRNYDLWTTPSARKHSRHAVSAVTFCLGLLRYWCFISATKTQPRCISLEDNIVLTCGHLLVLIGLLLIGMCIHSVGLSECFHCPHSAVFGSRFHQRIPPPYRSYGDAMSFGTMLCFLGVSLQRASPAGLILSLCTAISSCSVFDTCSRFSTIWEPSFFFIKLQRISCFTMNSKWCLNMEVRTMVHLRVPYFFLRFILTSQNKRSQQSFYYDLNLCMHLKRLVAKTANMMWSSNNIPCQPQK